MTAKTKSLLVRCTVFLVLAALLFVFVRPFFYIQLTQTGYNNVELKDVGVFLELSPDGSTTVKVDDREETVPKGQLKSSALNKEAMERISSRMRSQRSQEYPQFRLRRFMTWWVFPTVILYVLMFQIPPRRPYIEGGPA